MYDLESRVISLSRLGIPKVIDLLKLRSCYSYVHNPILEARHWSIVGGQYVDAAVYHRTHSGYAVASFLEALRLLLEHGLAQKTADYTFFEQGLKKVIKAMDCEVTSNMTSLVICNLPGSHAGR